MSITDTGDKPKKEKGLTQKQEDFCLAYVETSNASEAYRRSYDCSPGTKPEVIHVKASELMANGKVKVRITELQERASAKVVLNRSWVLERLMRNADKAIELEDVQGSNKALELLGKTDELAMFTDKSETKTTMTGSMTLRTVDTPPTETREDWLARRKRELAAAAQSLGTAARPAN